MALPAIKVPIEATDRLSKGLGAAQKRLDHFSKRVGDLGKKMTTHITLPLAGAAVVAGKFGMDFNRSMANVGTLIPGQTQRIIGLKKEVQDLAKETGKSTGDLATGLYQVISAFGDSGDAAKILEINAKAAMGGAAETIESINLTSAVTKAWGNTSASAVQKVADLGLLTVRLGQTTFPELAGSIGRVTPLAKELGVSMEEMFATFATSTGVTGNAAEVSTQMASVMGALLKPTSQLSSLYDHLGISSGKALVKQLGFQGALKLISDKARAADVPLATLLGRKEAMILALTLAGEQSDTYKTKLGEMSKSAGTTAAAYLEMTTGINLAGHTFDKAIQSLTVMAQVFGDVLAPAITKVGGKVIELAQWVSNLGEGWKTTIVWIAGITAVVGPLLVGLGFLASTIANIGFALKFLVPLVHGLNAAMLLNPWVAAAAGAIGLGMILWKFRKQIIGGLVTAWEKLKEVTGKVWTWISGFLDTRIGKIVAVMTPMIGIPLLIIKHWDKVTDTIGRVGEVVGKVAGGIADFFGFGNDEIRVAGATAGGGGLAFGPAVGADNTINQMAEIRRSEYRREESTVRVAFDNLPRGTRVQQDSGGRDVDMSLGYAMGQ